MSLDDDLAVDSNVADINNINLSDEWEQSYIEHQEQRCVPNAAVPALPLDAPSTYTTDLDSDTLLDLLEIEELGSAVSWPSGLDARIARIILRDRSG